MNPQELKNQIITTLKELDQLLAGAQATLDSDENVKRLRSEYDEQASVKEFRAKVQSYNNQKTELLGALKAINIISPPAPEAAPAVAEGTEAGAAPSASGEATTEASSAAPAAEGESSFVNN